MQCHIKVSDLALTFSWNTHRKTIFKDLNLCIPRGSFVTLVGGNGSGKSSLIKLILGLIRPDQGEIMVLDKRVRPGYPEDVRHGQIAYLSQQIEDLFFAETVAEELHYFAGGVPPNSWDDFAHALGLSPLLDRTVESLSGGERQSLALAQFINTSASLLIMDEPSSYLDHAKSTLLQARLKQEHSAGKTILHVSQFETELAWGTHVIDLDQDPVQLVAR